ncbi:DeoR family transcriptional regulator [Bacillus sp. FJAT-49736]|uniref:DeoR family transcriptional regulator n=1 Tax=Bacillus sp. FJAT-49736 TaxID=2833582 RepID=UPI001BC9F2B2|nr:DeoR family transcriptional regulator [Bacillus sp. FJAT-49736]MBS4174936.1 DeoR/GlpR transcriptional regulator [Bacillus sp. FJAT-49736]
MLPVQRQQQIITWLEKETTISVSELSKRLNVSEMTIYRDIKPLIEQNKIIKTSKGISYTRKPAMHSQNCTYCYKEANTRHSMQIITLEQTIEHTCCPHCGLLRYEDIKEEVSQIICKDFLSGITISAKVAYYLIGADFQMNCCRPQAIVFESYKQIEQFQKGFGGLVFTFEEAITQLKNRMKNPPSDHCSS